MEVRASAKFIRMSPRKVRLVTDLIKGKSAADARVQLAFMAKAARVPVLKLLNSAIANATHNFKLSEDNLVVKAAMADQGPVLKRWRARAMGRAAPILKRTSHITIVLTEKVPTVVAPKTEAKAEAKVEEKKAEAPKKAKAAKAKPAAAKAAKAPRAKKAAAKESKE